MMDIDYAHEKSMLLFIFTSAGGEKREQEIDVDGLDG